MTPKNIFIAVVWIAFSLFSLPIAIEHGVFGFLTLSAREPWALQMLLDLFIALSLFAGFVMKDAKARGIRAWPWIVAMFALGSIGALPYLLYRTRFDAEERGASPRPTIPRDARA